MLPRLTALALVLTFGCGVLISALLDRQPHHINPLAFQTCELPCWSSLQFGASSTSEFEATIEQVNLRGNWGIRGLSRVDRGDRLQEFYLVMTDVQLGDALLMYGEPDAVYIEPTIWIDQTGIRQIRTMATLYWVDGYIRVEAIDSHQTGVISPHMPVVSLRMLQLTPMSIIPLKHDPEGKRFWRGFGNIEGYKIG